MFKYAAFAVIPYPLTQEIGADYLAYKELPFAVASHKSIRRYRYDPNSHHRRIL